MEVYISQLVKGFEGKSIKIVDSEEISKFLEVSKNIANQEWLYHCTDKDALISILKNKEFYLKNLVDVNDEEEAEAIDVEHYRNTFYVGCFSSEIVDSDEHRKEYGNSDKSVIIAVKKEWFTKKVRFLKKDQCEWIDKDDTFRIFPNLKEVMEFQKYELQNGRCCYPYYIEDFDFYGIIYDDEKKNIQRNIEIEVNGYKPKAYTFVPELAGIIKKKSGISRKTKEYRNWFKEKEIRLKACIHQEGFLLNGNEYHDGAMIPTTLMISQVVVSLTENAFDTLYIYFPETFTDKKRYLDVLKKEFPNIKISVMDKNGVL